MKNDVTVKIFSEEYQDQVINLILSIQQQEYNIPITKQDQPDLFSINSIYKNGDGNFWIAIYNNEVVGTISLLDIGNKEVALRKMFVDKEYRGSKYKTASLLLNTAIGWAKEKSVRTIYLGTTPQFLAAHKFYEKNRFISIREKELPENFPILQVDKKFYKYNL